MASEKGPGQGFEYEPYPVSWNKRDILLFANSIGCTVDELHFLYELHPKFQTFPTYAVILPFKHTHTDVIDFYAAQGASKPIPGVPKFDSKRVVDGERKLEFLKPLPVTSEGRRFEVRSKVLGVWDKGKPGSVVDTQFEVVDKDSNEVYVRAKGSGFYVGQGGWGGPKGPKTPSFNPPTRAPDTTYTQPTGPTTAHLYRLNGDYNPLHATPEPGKAMGFGGAIMHGLYSWNSSAHALLASLGGSDPANMKEFQARFASPVRPGDTLLIEMWRMGGKDSQGFEEIRFVVKVKETGKVVLSNGRALIKVVEQGSKSKL